MNEWKWNLGEIRAVQLDLARQLETVGTVCHMLDVAATAGMNMVVLYLEDRIKTASYPYNDDAESYSATQIAEIHRYADRLGLELVPVVSNYGHTERFLKHQALAHISELRGNIAGRFSEPGHAFHNVVCPELPETYAFFDRYIAEVASMFTSRYFHVGLDEIFNMGHCDLCRAKMGDKGLSALFTPHILHTHALLASLGKTMMMWDDMFEECPETLDAIPNDIILCAWHYDYINRYPDGQFNNSLRHDALSQYDARGFAYLLCSWDGLWNTNSITEYARRHRPLGMLMTTWEMAYEPLHVLEPLIVQAGLYWQGICTQDDVGRLMQAVHTVTPCEDAYAAAAAEALVFCSRCGRVDDPEKRLHPFTKGDEQHYLHAELLLKRLYALEDAVDPDYAEAFRHRTEWTVLEGRLGRLARRIFDHRTGDCREDMESVIDGLEECRLLAQRIYDGQLTLWSHARYPLSYVRLTDKLAKLFASIDRMKALATSAEFGAYGRLELHVIMSDQTTAAKLALTVTYADGTSDVLEDGAVLKSRFIRSPSFTVDYPIPAHAVPVSVTCTVWGYGAMGIAWVDIHNAAGVYTPAAVLGVTGKVVHPANLLMADSCVCLIGEEHVQESFRVPMLARIKHSVTLHLMKASSF